MKNLAGNINAKFKDLIAESFHLVPFSFKTDIGTTNWGAITHEMSELQADNEASIHFDVFQDIAISGYGYPTSIQQLEMDHCMLLCDSEALMYVRQDSP